MSLLVYITVPDGEIAETLARGLVEAGLAAGVNVAGPVFSVYRWQGDIHEAKEWQLFCQTDKTAFNELREFVLRNHPHSVPCIMGMATEVGNPAFINWINRHSRK